ncbi:hypothetical protein EG68_04540 [Paragonimus skrjabini miyazakii]|uniref:BTB domain-containing protein n=1 Tax=Paragonimus skrjabini miyazakii TaxID=59628 RepID=A0A8S9YYJ3_9TREM|nr:hypothetical protein EG68_04540 [Paragonimus skrjabini miyazakii]
MPTNRARLSVKGENYVFGDSLTYSKNMEHLLAEEKYCDTRFLVGQKVHAIYGHKAIIASRCPTLSAMLLPSTNDLMESVRSSHVIKDMEPDIFRTLIRFLYTNSINFEAITTDKLIEMLRTSLKFQLSELAKLIEAHLTTVIDVNTVFELLNVGVKYKSNDIKGSCMNFIVKFSTELLTADNGSLATLTPAAMLTILKSDELPVSELTLFHMAAEWADSYLYRVTGGGTHQVIPTKPQYSQLVARRNSSKYYGRPLLPRSVSYGPNTLRAAAAAVTAGSSHRRVIQTKRAVMTVMSAIRYALLTPAELTEIESNPEWKQIIPPNCLADAWRIITFRQTGQQADEKLTLPTKLPRCRAQVVFKHVENRVDQ